MRPKYIRNDRGTEMTKDRSGFMFTLAHKFAICNLLYFLSVFWSTTK